MARVRVLFTGGGGAGTASLWEQLSTRYEVYFADANPRRIAPSVPLARRITVPMARDEHFVSELTRHVRQLDIDLLVPGVDEELLPLAGARSHLEPCEVLLPTTADIARYLDKLTFIRALESAGIRAPATARLDEVTDWQHFPCIAKPRTGRGSAGLMLIRDAAALAGWRSVVDSASDVIVQELVRGSEFTVQVVANRHGELQAIVPVRVHAKRGITLSASTDGNARVIASCRQLHAAFPTAGVVNVQGMLDDAGEFWPFEVNPRVSTTVCLVIAAGVDPLALFHAPASAAVSLAPFTNGLAMERFWETSIGQDVSGSERQADG